MESKPLFRFMALILAIAVLMLTSYYFDQCPRYVPRKNVQEFASGQQKGNPNN